MCCVGVIFQNTSSLPLVSVLRVVPIISETWQLLPSPCAQCCDIWKLSWMCLPDIKAQTVCCSLNFHFCGPTINTLHLGLCNVFCHRRILTTQNTWIFISILLPLLTYGQSNFVMVLQTTHSLWDGSEEAVYAEVHLNLGSETSTSSGNSVVERCCRSSLILGCHANLSTPCPP